MSQKDFDPLLAEFLPSKKRIKHIAIAAAFTAASVLAYTNRQEIGSALEAVKDKIAAQCHIAPPR